MSIGKPIFDIHKHTLLLNIAPNASGLNPDFLSGYAEKNGFEKKDELHITVLGFRHGRKIEEALSNSTDRETLEERIADTADNTDWTFEIEPTAYHITKKYDYRDADTGEQKQETREAIIRAVKIDSLVYFFDRLNEILGTEMEPPSTHITLYTKGTDKERSRGGIGIDTDEDFQKMNPRLISQNNPGEEKRTGGARKYVKIVLPTRPQPDTIVAIFILKKFGAEMFPEIKEAEIDFWQIIPEGENEESLDGRGIILIDLGGGRFDHHGKIKTTASNLIASYLGIADDPALVKLLEYARRDDFFGKGTVSDDPIDRAFGLSALIASLNKSLVKNPAKVIELVLPFIIAHYNEESKRTKELPKEFEEKIANKEAETFMVRQRDKNLKVVIVNSDNGSLAGYLRSQNGGRFDIVAQWLPSGHVNILTRPTKRVDLRSLAALLRLEEATASGSELVLNPRSLAGYGRIKEIQEWYYDPATNSIQNGGLNPREINPTKIPRERFKKIIELGLSEQLWDPRA